MNEFSFDLIHPTAESVGSKESYGRKIVVIGRPGSGKSTLIKALAYSKRDVIKMAVVFSGSEMTNGFYSKFIPDLFIYDGYNESAMNLFMTRQKKVAPEFISRHENKWVMIVVDDCSYAKEIFNSPTQRELYKNGRHYKMLYVLGVQYVMDIPADVRNNIDGVFLFHEPNKDSRKRLYRNFGGVVPDFARFEELMDTHTGSYRALYIDNTRQSNDWKECVYSVEIDPPPDRFDFGCVQYREHDRIRNKRSKKSD